jgi:hypothetical protein
MMHNQSAHTVPITYYMYQNVIIWELFCTLPFALSQQVYLCVILLAVVVGKTITRLISEIDDERVYYQTKISNAAVLALEEVEGTESRVRNWEMFYMQSLMLCACLNRFFSLILFMIISIDFITILGFTSGFIIGEQLSSAYFSHIIFSVVLFLAYETLFLLPFIAVYEKLSRKKI